MRKRLLAKAKRSVIKVGSAVITSSDGLNMEVIGAIASDICGLLEERREVILVSSGAIASGLRRMGLTKKPESTSQKQALAAIGQSLLMKAYEEAFGLYGRKVAQVLLTRDDLSNRKRYLNARNTLLTLLAWKIVPVINENDTVSIDEIKFGDNDNLSAMVTNLTDADLLLSLTSTDGLYDKDPNLHKDACLIAIVKGADKDVLQFAGTAGRMGTGGMAAKVMAARKVALAGVPTVIANGTASGMIKRVFEGMETGTLFVPNETALCGRKHWIAFTKSPRGDVMIDRGAAIAVVEKGKSLLPSGIIEVKGRFSQGDSVNVLGPDGKAIAMGMVNYHSGEIRKIAGARSSEIESRLGFRHDDEVIHRDNLVLMTELEEEEGQCR
ncbi:MAG: glutamate 5-kinase [Deltaproteobacteria bacterium CG_4_8_14_3_um_filter_51_11]|nr:glutamate 5-kinase [bacterium]OIP37344.1 MAG: glutamate 5-kinase [Desulfobacteraceae bacterium CG2_30_51_40]PIP47672.1 MAG: glutamate 5-kinase [Deltaproteobacteria bacterium CG23_combo_of_CG06-09_8_20_14_all_51_20]PIV98953.1 MAG: glutamate 5-kinase [Deltaproteobacteria bacterium CG17_big_fil_post_rev_8_21_14_2_50_51_6]PIX18989.1 MAG: glutamate 5-kinase [Deltaproteobacteria bacterium CG_4_8_14_3_um_filter_51_11]PIY21863.1 MAG: glutamate 5-kinase [Deltaproteobacteria bacterium CG_4_10_14_3_um